MAPMGRRYVLLAILKISEFVFLQIKPLKTSELAFYKEVE
jgi:hypothetical protein